MKKLLNVLLGTLLLSGVAQAANLCEGHAKYGAMTAYMDEMGVVQGSDGATRTATLVDNLDSNKATYLVSINDNNEDGDYWTVNYLVKVALDGENSCQVNSTKKVGVVVPLDASEEE